MQHDNIFKTGMNSIGDFKFDKKVANVFNDMLERSIPFYREVIRMTTEMTRDHYQSNTNIYDIGCSVATQIIALKSILPQARIIGIDYSTDMIERANENLKNSELLNDVELIQDKAENINFHNASVVIMNYTLQFIDPSNRDQLIKNISNAMKPGALLIISEKIKTDSDQSYDPIKYYLNLKRRNGYSELEIANKRDALENVLIPASIEKLKSITKKHNLVFQEIFFKWHIFTSMVFQKK